MSSDGVGVSVEVERERLRERYRRERDKRIRPEGTEQYVKLDPFSEYLAGSVHSSCRAWCGLP